MQYPTLTAIYGALFALIFVALSAWVIAGRLQFKVNLGEGQNQAMQVRVRAHGNFMEYVPFILLLVGFLEMAHESRFAIHALLLPLLIARVVHPFGLFTAADTSQQFAFRGAPVLVTLAVLAIAAVLLLFQFT